MIERISKIYGRRGDDQNGPFEITRDILLSAERRIVHGGSLRYLEVTEDNSQRQSFDINLYDARIDMREMRPFFVRMFEHYALPSEWLETFLELVESLAVGHLAGGIHRRGEDFFNIYYGAEERQGAGETVMADQAHTTPGDATSPGSTRPER